MLIEELGRAFDKRDGHLACQIAGHARAVQAALWFEDFFVQFAVELEPLVGPQILQEAQRRLFEVILSTGENDSGGVGLADGFPERFSARHRGTPQSAIAGDRSRAVEVLVLAGRAVEVFLEMPQALPAEP